jgi:hypothetical protein
VIREADRSPGRGWQSFCGQSTSRQSTATPHCQSTSPPSGSREACPSWASASICCITPATLSVPHTHMTAYHQGGRFSLLFSHIHLGYPDARRHFKPTQCSSARSAPRRSWSRSAWPASPLRPARSAVQVSPSVGHNAWPRHQLSALQPHCISLSGLGSGGIIHHYTL